MFQVLKYSILVRNSKFKILNSALVFGATLLAPLVWPSATTAAQSPLAQRAAGRLLLQADQRGQAWYVNPADGSRYFMRDPDGCWKVATLLALGVRNADLEKISAPGKRSGDTRLVRRLAGRFLLGVEQRGALSYVSPVDNRPYPITDAAACWAAVLRTRIGVKAADLRQVPMNQRQVTFDPAFDGVAAASIVNGKITAGTNANQVLPVASLTKLMTALVLLDRNPEWQREITLTADDLTYPQGLVDPGDVTSEVPFTAGDTVTVRDLWRAMLVASSNQATAVLAKHSGLAGEKFVAAMNARADALGLTHTRFTDPSGLDPWNVSTAAEMAGLAAAAFAHPDIAATSVMGQFTIRAGRPNASVHDIPVVNRNATLLRYGPDGAKSGFLHEAQRTVAVRRGQTIVVILHARSMKERNRLLAKFMGER